MLRCGDAKYFWLSILATQHLSILLSTSMRILGIDYGTKRIGLAVGETDSGMAFPLRSVPNDAAALDVIIRIAGEESVGRLVIGMPYRMTGAGAPGETESAVIAFIGGLKKKTELPIDTEDERLTTAMVEKMRKDAGVKPKDFDKDAAAATVILESYLARKRA